MGLQGWQSWADDHRICRLCKCTKGSIQDAHLTAEWRSTLCTTASLVIEGEDQYISGLFSIPGMSLTSVHPDMMHVADLGTVQYLLGCIFWDLFRELKAAHGLW